MSEISSNNKRIAKNTLLLYARMLMLMFIALFTSRVNLQSLGIVDYGIYNVVGGIVVMFSVLSGSLSAAISRFLTYELGKGDIEKLKCVFSSSVTIQFILSGIIVLLAETIGLWFLNEKMVIPPNRIIAANWVYQFSVLTFVLNLISIPYNAAIIAHERMSAFAYITIFEAIGKLLIAYVTFIVIFDKLICFSAMICFIGVIIRVIYGWYCKRHFKECSFHFMYDQSLFKKMFSFAGWNFLGASSDIFRDQGGNILINMFFGPSANAARGIAVQVNTAVIGFVKNFTTAINPQITKSYASGDSEYMMNLVFQGARFSFYILLILSLPIIINTPYLLHLWLGNVPEHTDNFVRLVLVFSLSETLSYTLVTSMLATGNIKNYQLVVGGLALLNLPLCYLCFKFGAPIESIYVVAIVISVACEAARLFMLRRMIKLPVKKFLNQVYFKVILVSVLASFAPVALYLYSNGSIWLFILNCLVCLISSVFCILFVGCNSDERSWVYTKMSSLLSKMK